MAHAASGKTLIFMGDDCTYTADDFGDDDADSPMAAAEVLADQLACGAITSERAAELADGLVQMEADDDGPLHAPTGSREARVLDTAGGALLDRLKAGTVSPEEALEVSESLSYDGWAGDEAA